MSNNVIYPNPGSIDPHLGNPVSTITEPPKTFGPAILEARWNSSERAHVEAMLTRLLSPLIDPTKWNFGAWQVPKRSGLFIPNAPWLRSDIAAQKGLSRPSAKKAHTPVIVFCDIDYDVAPDGTKSKVPLEEQVRRVIESGLPPPTWTCLSGDDRDGANFIGGKSIHFAWVGIGSVKEFEQLADLFARKLGADPVAKNRAHLFRLPGGEWVGQDRQQKRRQTVLWVHDGQVAAYKFDDLSAALAPRADLPTAPVLNVKAAAVAGGKRGSKSGKPFEYLEAGYVSQLRGGGTGLLEGLPTGTRVCCPSGISGHDDAVVLSDSGRASIYCHHAGCAGGKNWVLKQGGVFSTTSWTIAPQGKGKHQAAKKPVRHIDPFRFTDLRHGKRIGEIDFSWGDELYIKAPREAGKTHELILAAKRFLVREKKRDIVWVLHRRSLVSQVVRRLRAAGVPTVDYRDVQGTIHPEPESPRVIVICLDSITRLAAFHSGVGGVGDPGIGVVKPVRWGAVLIDEVEQCWSHLVGETIGSDYDNTYDRLRGLVHNADTKIVADADLSRHTVLMIRRMIGSLRDAEIRMTMPSGTLIVSEVFPARAANIHASSESLDLLLRSDFVRLPQAAVAIHTSSLLEAKRIDKMARGLGRNPILVCSETVGENEVAAFLTDPNQWLTDHPGRDLVYSPSMGTGVSIDGAKFRKFYAYLDPRSGPGVYDHMQAIDRVRSPVDPIREIFIDATELPFPTDASRISERALWASGAEAKALGAAAIPGTSHYQRGDKLTAVPGNREAFQAWSEIIARRNTARNQQRSDLLHLMKDAHWAVTYAPTPTDAEAVQTKTDAKASRKAIKAEEIENIMSAPADMPATEAEAILHRGKRAGKADIASAMRAELRDLAPGVAPGERQVKAHKSGKLRAQIARYATARAMGAFGGSLDKRTLELIKAESFHHLGASNGRRVVRTGALLSLIVLGKIDEAAMRKAAQELRMLGVSVGNPESSKVKEIVGMAWTQLGIERKQIAQSRVSTVSLETDSGNPTSAAWEQIAKPECVQWMESAADAWLVRTQERLKAYDDPALPGRTPRHALLVSPEDAAQDTRMAEIVHWLLDENWEPVDSASPVKVAA